MKFIVAMTALAVAAAAARADEVVLRNGARFEGQVKESGETVTVVMDFGTITFKKMDVARIDRGPSALMEFDAKAAELKAGDIEGRFKLATWAKHKGLSQRATRMFEEILERDPQHAGAREELGYRRAGNRWVTEEEWRAEQGLVYFRGEWLKRETADEIRRIEAERAAEIAKLAAIEQMRIRTIEAEAAAASRLRAEEEEARLRAQAVPYDDYYYRPAVTFFSFRRCAPVRSAKPIHLGNVLFFPAIPGKCK